MNSKSISAQEHWDRIYATRMTQQLGWYEAQPVASLQLIQNCQVSKDAPIIDIGSGTSTLIPALLGEGFENLFALDISQTALSKAGSLIGEHQANKVKWIVGDITSDTADLELPKVVIWHDRAVLHFQVDQEARDRYLFQLNQTLLPGGFAIISAFALDGATKCSGLDVVRYDSNGLGDLLGETFKLLESFDYKYTMPSGDQRPFVYARFQKQ